MPLLVIVCVASFKVAASQHLMAVFARAGYPFYDSVHIIFDALFNFSRI
jgi:hypothetical protein